MEFRYDDNLSRRMSSNDRGISRNRYSAERYKKQRRGYKLFKKVLFIIFIIVIFIGMLNNRKAIM